MNPARGEAAIIVGGSAITLRPTFEALVHAEEEIGSLFAFAERAASGELKLGEIATLFWHCAPKEPAIDRRDIGAAVVEQGFVRMMPVLRTLLGQIIQGRA